MLILIELRSSNICNGTDFPKEFPVNSSVREIKYQSTFC